MMFKRLCAQCGRLVVCSRETPETLVCTRCGGDLVGPFGLPTPSSYRERVEVLSSPLYSGAVSSESAPSPPPPR